MKLSSNTILLPALLLTSVLLLAGCYSNVNRAFYEGIKSQNEGYKTPTERVNSPSTPSFDAYQKERERLQHNNSAPEKNMSPDFNLK